MLTFGKTKEALYDAACALMNEKHDEVINSIANSYFYNDKEQADAWLHQNRTNIEFIRRRMRLAARTAISEIYPEDRNEKERHQSPAS